MGARLDLMALASCTPVAVLRRASRLTDIFGPSWAAAFRVLADRMDSLLAENRDLRARLAKAEAELARVRPGHEWQEGFR